MYPRSRLSRISIEILPSSERVAMCISGSSTSTLAVTWMSAAVTVPGPSAVVTALAVSGLPTRQFTYVGFLPRRKGERRRLLSTLAAQPQTIVALESPYRLLATLSDLLAVLDDRRIAVCRELTKLHEEVFRGRISEAIAYFQEPRGEFTLVLEGAPQPAEAMVPTEAVLTELRQLRQQGVAPRQAVTQVAQRLGLPRRQVYRLWLQL